jgi:hypothetical protein
MRQSIYGLKFENPNQVIQTKPYTFFKRKSLWSRTYTKLIISITFSPNDWWDETSHQKPVQKYDDNYYFINKTKEINLNNIRKIKIRNFIQNDAYNDMYIWLNNFKLYHNC